MKESWRMDRDDLRAILILAVSFGLGMGIGGAIYDVTKGVLRFLVTGALVYFGFIPG